MSAKYITMTITKNANDYNDLQYWKINAKAIMICSNEDKILQRWLLKNAKHFNDLY